MGSKELSHDSFEERKRKKEEKVGGRPVFIQKSGVPLNATKLSESVSYAMIGRTSIV